jgi:predicted AAA+ superfamily ATPase
MNKQILQEVIIDQSALTLKETDVKRFGIIGTNDSEIVVISGIRRCGKSTLMQEIRNTNSEKDYYLNFDDDRLLHFTVDDFQTLLELLGEMFGKQTTFYFDEIQNIRGWERFVRRLYDYGNKVYVTGSNASMLSRELGTHLTGRFYQIELFPFSFLEYLKLKQIDIDRKDLFSTDGKAFIKSEFNNFFNQGGFPAYLKTTNRSYLKSLYESILYRDVMVRNSLTNEREMLELVYYIASNTSKLISYNSLAKAIGVKNATTVKNYLSFLQDSYLIFLVSKYDVSVKKQIQNHKKVYFIDSGLIRELSFQHSENNGRLLENLVFIELRRMAKEVYYHNQKHECDFVIKEKNIITEAIQVCWSLYDSITRKRELNGLLDAMEAYNLSSGIILTESEEEELIVESKKIHVIPVWKWLLKPKS